jgi:hypothetical protein
MTGSSGPKGSQDEHLSRSDADGVNVAIVPAGFRDTAPVTVSPGV